MLKLTDLFYWKHLKIYKFNLLLKKLYIIQHFSLLINHIYNKVILYVGNIIIFKIIYLLFVYI